MVNGSKNDGLQSLGDSDTLCRAKETANDLRDRGFHVFANALPPHSWFFRVYEAFDRLSNAVSTRPEIIERWSETVRQWQLQNDNRDFFCGVPFSYRNRSGKAGKRDKAYIQSSLEFVESKTFQSGPLAKFGELTSFLEFLAPLHFTCAELFGSAISSICELYGTERAFFEPLGRRTPIIFKLILYNGNPLRFATDAHYDKSALSLILHSDDVDTSVRVGPGGARTTRYSQLVKPMSYPDSASASNHALLIAGSHLRLIGIPIDATPHCVLPVTGDRPRHALVAFCLIPFIDPDKLSTEARLANDYYPAIT